MHFLNIYILTNALYVLTEGKYIIFWDVQMIEGQRTKIFSWDQFFLDIVRILFWVNFVIIQPLYTIALCAILVYVQMYKIIYLIKCSIYYLVLSQDL
jgi:hypothetical protein